jgi:hypothetical protein
MCAKLFNIFTPGKNLHLCLDILARVQRAPVIVRYFSNSFKLEAYNRQFQVLHFDCMRMGLDGGILLKPEANGGVFGDGQTLAPPQYAGDFYDEVNETKV